MSEEILIRDKYSENDSCPCGSNKFASTCCFTEKGWLKTPATIVPRDTQTNYKNEKCYASKTSNCSSKISKEHYISANLIKIINDERKSIPIEGLSWIPFEESHSIGVNSLVSYILCERHNNALSPLDVEAGKFLKAFGNYDSDFNSKNPREELLVVCGEDLERWMLKTICGLVSTGHLSIKGEALQTKINEFWVDILYGNKPWPPKWGLYMSTPEQQIHHRKSFSFKPMIHPTTNELLLVEMQFNNFQFHLCLGNIDNPSSLGVHRPRTLIFEQNKVKKVIEISWLNRDNDYEIHFIRTSAYDGEPPTKSKTIRKWDYLK